MREHGAQVESYKGRRLIIAEHHAAPASSDPGAAPLAARPGVGLSLAFLEPGLVALGSTALVRGAIDLKEGMKDGGESVRTNAEIMDLVRSLERGNVWAVGRFDTLSAQANLPSRVADQLPPITWFSVSGRVNGGILGEIRAQTRDEDSANNLRDVVRGVMAVGKLQAAAHPELEVLLRSLQLGGTGTTVALSFELPAELLDVVGALQAR
jgi:hypothetical protein